MIAAEQYNLLDRIEAARKHRPRVEKPVCPRCGAKQVEHRHALVKGLAIVAIRLFRFGRPAKLRELALPNAAFANAQKLKYFGITEQVEIDETRTGKWQLTDLGEQWVRNTIRLPKHAITFRNQVLRTEGPDVLITECVDRYQWRIEWAEEAMPHESAA